MATQAQLDAAFKAAMPIVTAEINNEETQIPVFVRRQAIQQIAAHEAQIEAVVKQILKAGIDAALAVT
jgi:hypothetical protein